MRLLSIQIGQVKTLGHPSATDIMDREWTTGFFKEPVYGPIWVGKTGLDGDAQADLRVHGGPDKAINVYPAGHYAYWHEDLGRNDMTHGAFGENFTVSDATERDVCIGDVFEIGGANGALVQVSQPRQPCWKLARRWRIKDLTARVERTGKTGWYFRVLREGMIEAGSDMVLIERPFPDWTIDLANEVMRRPKLHQDVLRAMSKCPALSESWRESFSET